MRNVPQNRDLVETEMKAPRVAVIVCNPRKVRNDETPLKKQRVARVDHQGRAGGESWRETSIKSHVQVLSLK